MLLLESFAVHGSMEELKRQALEENLLGKTSSYTVKGMLRAFEQRFLVPHPPLPPAEQVALATCSSIPNVAKLHILFPYYLAADDLVRDVYLGLVLPSYHGQGQVSRGNNPAILGAIVCRKPRTVRMGRIYQVALGPRVCGPAARFWACYLSIPAQS
jgi:hypothetical protein